DAGLAGPRDAVLSAVVADGVGTEFAAEFGLALGPDGDGALHAEVACDLDRGRAASRTAAVDEQPLACRDSAAADDVRPHGGEHLGQGGGLGEVEAIGHGQELTGREDRKSVV